jgi:antirestriction protein ArdC
MIDLLQLRAPFGSVVYSKEEFCAEMGAAYPCAEAGISTTVIENHAAYVAEWLKKWRARHFFQ